MEPRATLLLAAALGLPTAVVTPLCLPAGVALVVAGLLVLRCAGDRVRFAGLLPLTLLLAALPTTPTTGADWPRAGPVQVRATVVRTERLPDRDATRAWLQSNGRPVRLTVHGALPAVAGDRIAFLGHLTPGATPDRPPSLHARPSAIRILPARPTIPRALARVRAAGERALLELVPGERGPVLATLVLGRATRAPQPVADAHRATGLSHLLAVSGAHAAMLGFMLGLGTFAGGRRAKARRLASRRLHVGAALLVLFAYAGITGGEPPVLRAVLMYALAAFATHVGRDLGLVVGLAVPALLTAATNPAELLGPSFLLSYAAVYGLSLAVPDRPADDDPTAATPTAGPPRWLERLRMPLVASFWATLMTAPITLAWFGQIAPWTIVLTPLLAPLVAVILMLGLVAAVVANISTTAAAPLAPVLGQLTGRYIDFVQAADELPATPVRAWTTPGPTTVALTGIAIVTVFVFLRGRRRIGLAAGLAMAPWFVDGGEPGATGAARFELFAVGHGQAAALTTATGTHIAIDCGSMQLPFLAAAKLVRRRSRRELDWLVITHGDHDHHNGVPALLRRVRVHRALLPAELAGTPLAEQLERHGTTLTFLEPGTSTEPTAHVAVAAPRLGPAASSNDKSLWITIREPALGATVLLCGDASTAGIAAAITQGLAPRADVLVLPHHGRQCEAIPRLLAAVDPRVCLASAASPDGETTQAENVRAHGADLRVTGTAGDLRLAPDGLSTSEPHTPLPSAR
ncbi:MAG: ComEC/Rec2 family competence protein [bacterium]|nr:ComEC/Rec2 family competence protein [bacterium]